jgi:hypothetical protein
MLDVEIADANALVDRARLQRAHKRFEIARDAGAE